MRKPKPQQNRKCKYRPPSAVSEALEPRVLLSKIITLGSFSNPGRYFTDAAVVADSAGNLFGTTISGGNSDDGAVYEIIRATETFTVLASFNGANGIHRFRGWPSTTTGNLFGTTFQTNTIFEVARGSGAITTLATFRPATNRLNNSNGIGPNSTPLLDSNGDLFGTTSGGGTKGEGVVYEWSRATGKITDLASFKQAKGTTPNDMVMDSNGNLFGTTLGGGDSNGNGAVFEIARGTATITDLAFFNGANGSGPEGLAMDSRGNLFGDTFAGGASLDGTVWEVATGATPSITLLASFNNTNGESPLGGVTVDAADNVFGSTNNGGNSNHGVVYEVAVGSGAVTVLAQFNGTNGSNPNGTPIVDSNGNLFATAYQDTDPNTDGGVYEVAHASNAITVLASLHDSGGESPQGDVAMDSSGNLFGATSGGGVNDNGTVFEIAEGTTSATTIASFNANANGANPNAGVVLDSNGNMFGDTTRGGANGDGTIYEIASGSNSITLLASFNNTNGATPYDGLTLDSHGNLFGTASAGGDVSGDGTIFEVASGTHAITALALFNGTNGSLPVAGVTLDSSGNLFGTAFNGGTSNHGTVWELTPGGGITTVALFNNTNGSEPRGGVVFDSSGNMFGTTDFGGSTFGVGTIWEIGLGQTRITVLAQFNETDGTNPFGSAVLDSDGDLFGTTAGGTGTVWEFAQGSGAITTLAVFNGANGEAPFGALILDSSDDLFGTTLEGGVGEAGTVFELPPTPPAFLNITTQPANTTAGHAIASFVVKIESSADNKVIGSDSSTVTLTVGSGPGTATGTLSVAAKNGVATFSNVILDTAGTYSLHVTDGGDGPADSNSFKINPAAAAHLDWDQQPTNATAGLALNPTVVVALQDAFGNICTGDTSTVTLAIATGPSGATFSGSSAVGVSAGLAEFDGVIFNTAGTYTLKATDGALPKATSTMFTIAPGAAAKIKFSVQPANAVAGVAISPAIVAQIKDSLGNLETSDTSTVTLAVASGPGTAAGTDAVAAVGGVATFSNVLLDKAGTYALSATDGSLALATSGSFTITHAAASQVVFGQQPTNVVAGVAIAPAITVKITDAFGNRINGSSATVNLTVASGPGSITTQSSIAAVAGVATFSDVVINKAGSYTLSATEGALTTATSGTFTVTHAAAAKLVFLQQPSNVAHGSAITPAITVEVADAFGNICPTNTSSITLSILSGPTGGKLTGTLTAAATAGVGSFGNVIPNKAGSYTLQATDGALTAAHSSQVVVS